MEKKDTVTLDFTTQKYISQLYQEMREKMAWHDSDGENLSALWDILRGMPYKGEDFLIIRPVQYRGIPHGNNAAFTEYVDRICNIFQRAHEKGLLTVNIQYTGNESLDIFPYLI